MERNLVMDETTKHPFWNRVCGDMTARDRHNLNRATWLLAGWLVSFAASTLLLKHELVPAGPLSWGVAALPSLVGVAVLFAYGRFLRHADELQRKIQLQAFAVGFGAAFFIGFGYRLFERLGAPPGNVSDLSSVLVFFYCIGLWLGRRRYL